MSKLEILQAGIPALRVHAETVQKIDKRITRLLKNMAETMYAAEGVGLAAPQVGVAKRMVVIDVGNGLFELINPVLTKKEGSVVCAEGCLSVPGFEGEVERAAYVECEFTDRTGKRMVLQAEGLLAIAVQHELDHLDGILFIDKAQSIMPKNEQKKDGA